MRKEALLALVVCALCAPEDVHEYDESVLPARHLPALLAELRALPHWSAAGVDVEAELAAAFKCPGMAKFVSPPADDPTGAMCVLFWAEELAYLSGRPVRGQRDSPYVQPGGWCGRAGLAAALRNFTARVAPPTRAPGALGSCAVVGSSGSLAGSGFGGVIDGYDAVVRVNSAPTEGHERDVGARTSVRVASVANLVLEQANAPPTPPLLLLPPDTMGAFTAAFPRFFIAGDAGGAPPAGGIDASRVHVLPLSLYAHAVLRWLNIELGDEMPGRIPPDSGQFADDAVLPEQVHSDKSRYHARAADASRLPADAPCRIPSIGLVAVLWALSACERVTLFGFTTTFGVTQYTYYFDKSAVVRARPVKSSSELLLRTIEEQKRKGDVVYGHDLEYERALIRRLGALGALDVGDAAGARDARSDVRSEDAAPSSATRSVSVLLDGLVHGIDLAPGAERHAAARAFFEKHPMHTPSCGDDVACLADALLAHADALPTWRRAPLGGIECVGGARAGENIVAFVGARAGSQRVPHKNVKPFAPDGRGLLEIAVGELSAALGGAPESIIFSSDSLSYDQTAARFAGVRAVPRDPYFASSECTVSEYHGHVGNVTRDAAPLAKHVLFFQVTQPLLNRTTIARFVDAFCALPAERDALLAVAPHVGHFIDKRGTPVNFDAERILGSQHLDALYVAGKMTLLRVDHARERANLLGTSPALFPLDELEAIDIDTQVDFEMAQYFYNRRQAGLI